MLNANISDLDTGNGSSLKRTNHTVIVSGMENFVFGRSMKSVQKALLDDRHTRTGVKHCCGIHISNFNIYKQQICKSAIRKAIIHYLHNLMC